MYGGTEAEARSNLVYVEWFDHKVPFSSINGAADSLRAVFRDLQPLYETYRRYLDGSSTFNWRRVRGTDRMSAHSYGIAIDIGVPMSDYWKWSYPNASETDTIGYKNQIPSEIVDAFERHGFISGTSWYHFDTMHFEYSPEYFK